MTKAISNSAQIFGRADIGSRGTYVPNQGHPEQFGRAFLSVQLTGAHLTLTIEVLDVLCLLRRSSIEVRALRRLRSSLVASVDPDSDIRNHLREILGP